MITVDQYVAQLKEKQKAIVWESEDDEGAGNYYGELQSIIDVCEYGTEEEIRAAAEYVGESCPL